MKKFSLIVMLVLCSQMAHAESKLKCEIEKSGSSTQTIEVEQDRGHPEVLLGDDQWVDISFFGKDIRLNVLRKPTAEEYRQHAKENGCNEIGLLGKIVGYAHVQAGAQVTYANLVLPNITITCESTEAK